MLFQLTPSAMPEGYGEALLPLAECKAWLSIDSGATEFDALIGVIRDAAIDGVEKYVNQFMGPRTGVVATFVGFAAGGSAMRLGRGPEASVVVTAIDYLDADGVADAIDAGGWRWTVNGLVPATGTRWPVGGSEVRVTFDAGYAANACPPALKTAGLMFVGHLFANREALIEGGLRGDLPAGVMWWCNLVRMPVL